MESTKIGTFLKESRVPGSPGNIARKITVKLYGKGVFAKQENRPGSENTMYYTRRAGQFIYSKLDFLNGAFGIIPDNLDSFESTVDLPCFDFIGDKVTPDWFLHYVSRTDFYAYQGGLGNGGRKARRISPDDFLELEIDLPPLPEQKKIAEILSGIDMAIESQCIEIDKVSAMHRIACQQKISDLSHNSEIATIGSISNKIMDYRGKSPPKHETGVPLITAKNIRKGFIDMNPAEFIQEDLYEEWMAKGIPSSGDILVTTEAPLGNVAVAPSSKFAIGQRVICISPNRRRITPEYLLACMKTDDFQGQLTASSTGSTVSGVRQGVLLDCNIPLPEIEWQRRIGSFDLNASKLITALTAKKAKLVTLKQSLASDLLSGRKRVSI
jgi:type I restriction enzyme S subunit